MEERLKHDMNVENLKVEELYRLSLYSITIVHTRDVKQSLAVLTPGALSSFQLFPTVPLCLVSLRVHEMDKVLSNIPTHQAF